MQFLKAMNKQNSEHCMQFLKAMSKQKLVSYAISKSNEQAKN